MMKLHMSDLPTPQGAGGISASLQKTNDIPPQPEGTGGKEKESGFLSQETTQHATSKEGELPKEVSAVGVKTHPTVVPLPENIRKMGVQETGENTPPPDIQTAVFPLTDDEIAKGLHSGIKESVRWLAEWCKRKLLSFRISIKAKDGKTVREKI